MISTKVASFCVFSLLYFCRTGISSPTTWQRASTRPKQPSYLGEDTTVDDAERVIRAGESMTQLLDTKKDIVLVIGNTGAGKTTITKFLTEFEKLEAYNAVDRILIRDTDQKISVDSTMVSKTIYPELFIDRTTGTAFYDLPGFSDTRNTSIELANAVLMKKVADHAQKVKLLFIVNYSSLRTGETRTDLKAFIEQSVELVKNPGKFKNGIALVATKVEGAKRRESIIQGIASYLTDARADLEEIFHDSKKRKAGQDLIDAFLSKDGSGNYNRISFFKQPIRTGPLNQFPEIRSQRTHMASVLESNIQYVASSPNDFGLTVSPAAKLVAAKLAERINERITMTMASLGNRLASNLEEKIRTSTWSSVGVLMKMPKVLENMLTTLTSTTTLQAFTETLKTIVSHLQMGQSTTEELAILKQRETTLKFLAEISGTTFPASILDWSQSIQISIKSFGVAVSKKVADFGTDMERQISAITQQVSSNFLKKLNSTGTAQQKQQMLEKFNVGVKNAKDNLLRAKTVNGFIRQVKQHVGILDKEVLTTSLGELTTDINFDDTLPFKILNWMGPFEKLTLDLKEGKYHMDLKILQDVNKNITASNTAALAALKNTFENQLSSYNKTVASLAEEIKRNRQKEDAERAALMKTYHEFAKILVQAISKQTPVDHPEKGKYAAEIVGSTLGGVAKIIDAAVKPVVKPNGQQKPQANNTPVQPGSYKPNSSGALTHGPTSYKPQSGGYTPNKPSSYKPYSNGATPNQPTSYKPYSGGYTPNKPSSYKPYSNGATPNQPTSYKPYSGGYTPNKPSSYKPYSNGATPNQPTGYKPYTFQ